MTVAELIKNLQKYPSNSIVEAEPSCNGYECCGMDHMPISKVYDHIEHNYPKDIHTHTVHITAF